MLLNTPRRSVRFSEPVDLHLSPSFSTQRRSISDVFGPHIDEEPFEISRYSSESLEYRGDFDVQISDSFSGPKTVLRLANPSDPEPD